MSTDEEQALLSEFSDGEPTPGTATTADETDTDAAAELDELEQRVDVLEDLLVRNVENVTRMIDAVDGGTTPANYPTDSDTHIRGYQ